MLRLTPPATAASRSPAASAEQAVVTASSEDECAEFDDVTTTPESEVAADPVGDRRRKAAGQAVVADSGEGPEEAGCGPFDDAGAHVRRDLGARERGRDDAADIRPAGPHRGGAGDIAGKGVADDNPGPVASQTLATGESSVGERAGRRFQGEPVRGIGGTVGLLGDAEGSTIETPALDQGGPDRRRLPRTGSAGLGAVKVACIGPAAAWACEPGSGTVRAGATQAAPGRGGTVQAGATQAALVGRALAGSALAGRALVRHWPAAGQGGTGSRTGRDLATEPGRAVFGDIQPDRRQAAERTPSGEEQLEELSRVGRIGEPAGQAHDRDRLDRRFGRGVFRHRQGQSRRSSSPCPPRAGQDRHNAACPLLPRNEPDHEITLAQRRIRRLPPPPRSDHAHDRGRQALPW